MASYAKIDMTNPGSGTGTVVNIQEAVPSDAFDPAFTWVDLTSVSPAPQIGWIYSGSAFIAPTPPAAPPLNQQYTPEAFGALLIEQFSDMNSNRGLSSDQKFTLAGMLDAYYILLQTGSLQAALDELGKITVDGVMITAAIITQFQTSLSAYLAGD